MPKAIHPFLQAGFRPFFLLGAIWAALAMALWICQLSGLLVVPSVFDPVAWHAHELIYGYGSAVICGFILTAVPNWTGRPALSGPPLAALVGLWLIGRVAVAFGEAAVPVAVLDLLFPAAFTLFAAREIIASGNRNYPVVAMFLLFTLGNAAFHIENMRSGGAAAGLGARLGISGLVLMISLIGGRIVPAFTRNWLKTRLEGALPVTFNKFDAAVLGASAVSLLAWSIWPFGTMVGGLLFIAGLAQLGRLARWVGWRTMSEPLVWVLHFGYLFIPVGFLMVATSILLPNGMAPSAAVHGWLAGAVGLMTLAVMTRASLGHTGRQLKAGKAETLIYLLIVTAVVTRLGYGIWPSVGLLHAAGTAWVAAFALFATAYWRVLTRPRADT